ncbi:MAG: hypothetical protein ACYCYR_15625 [Desulfobulbaceae bacterium]
MTTQKKPKHRASPTVISATYKTRQLRQSTFRGTADPQKNLILYPEGQALKDREGDFPSPTAIAHEKID